MYKRSLLLAALAGAAVAQETPTVVQALNATADLSSLNSIILNNTALAQTLGGLTNFTVLAPNNAAIEQFVRDNNASASNQTFLASVITYHVLEGTYTNFTEAAQFARTQLSDTSLYNITNGQVVEARNIDGNNTIFSGYLINSTAVAGPVTVQNGVVHVIDRVLTIPGNASSTGTELGLTSLVGAVVNASLAETLDTTRDLTIFAPNNEAFQAIGSAVANITAEQLASILQYHVVNQVLYSTDLTNTTVTSLQGGPLNVTVYNSTTVYVNNARVVTPNVLIANGVVHVIDEVLNPSNTTAPQNEPAYNATSVSTPPFGTQGGTPTRTDVPAASTTSSRGAGFKVQPTGYGLALLAGVALVL